MTQFIFNSEGIANVKDMPANIQEQYKGSGSGTVWVMPDGTVTRLFYNGEDAVTNYEVEQHAKQGGRRIECSFSSGQVLLDWNVTRDVIERYCIKWAADTEQDFFDVPSFGIDSIFVIHEEEQVFRQPSSTGGYVVRDGLYWQASDNCFEYITTEPLTE